MFEVYSDLSCICVFEVLRESDLSCICVFEV